MNKRVFRIFFTLCLIAYLALLVKVIIFKYPDAMTDDILRTWSLDNVSRQLSVANIIPFRTILNGLSDNGLPVEIPTIIYNIVAFMPLGFLVPSLSERARKLGVVLLAGVIVSFALEVIQLVTTLGAADIDDVILNVTGAVIGYGSFRLALAIYGRLFKPEMQPS